jgi:uncharacterized protein (UPF0305 family)
MNNIPNKAGLDSLDLTEAQRIGELVQVKIDSFLERAPNLLEEGYEEVFKEAYIELLFNAILRLNDNEDPREKINSPKITPEVVNWYKKAALALEEEEALREKYRKAFSGEKLTEH